ncbi:MAG: enoyl-CoA hydratase/isomerase family protein [Chloroflexi bacterium]|nr:enoyl-CoA hydratase/isomerase family protein [Chloroflexota bacterium]
MNEHIVLNRRDSIIEIVINRPDKRNAINWAMMAALGTAITDAERLAGARVVLLRGTGTGFSAGIDLLGFQDAAGQFGEGWRDNVFPLTQAYQNIVNQFERCSLPVIALLHGYCLGLGMELALACDFRLAAEGTKLGLPEARLGIIPDVGGTTRLARLVGPARAKELILTGRSIDAGKAEQWGIVNECVPPDDLLTRGEALAAEIMQAAPLAVSYAKRVINGLTDVERGLQLEAWAQNQLMRTEDFATGAQAMLTKQPAEWKGR